MPKQVFSQTRKAFAGIMIALSLFSIVGIVFGLMYYPESYNWDFQNYCFLGFDHGMNFVNAPDWGVLVDSSLVGYWNMNEGSGNVARDSSGNNNNGSISGATWVDGVVGKALRFDGTDDFVDVNSSLLENITDDITIAAFTQIAGSGSHNTQTVVGKSYAYFIGANFANKKFCSQLYGVDTSTFYTSSTYDLSVPHMIVLTYDKNAGENNYKLYVDGVLDRQKTENASITSNSNNFQIGRHDSTYYYLNGTIDEVRLYNRALSASEVAVLYITGDPASFSDYYNFKDPVTENTLLIHVDSPNSNSDNTALVTCTSFFENNKMVFNTNNSAIVNVWTNLGQPAFSTGVWNSQNYTTTLILDASTTAELRWNPASSPIASKISTTSTTAGNNITFSVLWSDNQTLFGGGYIFSTNNTGQWLNASWASFTSNPAWGNATLRLNSIVGNAISFREYANNSLNAWGDSGMYTITLTAPINTPTPNSTQTPTPTSTSTPTSTPTLTPTQANQFSTETILILVSVFGGLIALFALAFKKGYIKITFETVSDENSESHRETKEKKHS